MDSTKKYRKDMNEIMDICIKFCENRNPDTKTRETLKAIYNIAQRSKDDVNVMRFAKKLYKDKNIKKEIEDYPVSWSNYKNNFGNFYTTKLDNY